MSHFIPVPLELKEANAFVDQFHRHHNSVYRDKFRIGAMRNGKLVGVVQVGRPVSRNLDDGKTVEVTRLCTDGTEFYTKETAFLFPVPEMNTENERVLLFQKIGKIIAALDRTSCKTYIASYEEMKEAADHLAAFYDFCLKNSQEG